MRESKSARRERAAHEYATLCEMFPNPQCALNFTNAFELTVATVLSAQSTDRRVNMVTPQLFAKYPTPEALAAADPEDVESIIHSVGFYRSKTRNIIGLSAAVMEQFDGDVPGTMEELITLPGVGRKTANVVLGNAFGVPGFPVDTHVIRVTGRLRWRSNWRDSNPNPEHIEREICAMFPKREWTDLSHRLIVLGRELCHARTPDCASCPLAATCPSAG